MSDQNLLNEIRGNFYQNNGFIALVKSSKFGADNAPHFGKYNLVRVDPLYLVLTI